MGRAILEGVRGVTRVGISTAMDTGAMRPREEVEDISRGAKMLVMVLD
jgi:hypothetical protein